MFIPRTPGKIPTIGTAEIGFWDVASRIPKIMTLWNFLNLIYMIKKQVTLLTYFVAQFIQTVTFTDSYVFHQFEFLIILKKSKEKN